MIGYTKPHNSESGKFEPDNEIIFIQKIIDGISKIRGVEYTSSFAYEWYFPMVIPRHTLVINLLVDDNILNYYLPNTIDRIHMPLVNQLYSKIENVIDMSIEEFTHGKFYYDQ
jgi:hypothetical protein